jgi:tRNA modification GTPase
LARADDTIFALSTAPGRAGIAVIRISGPAAASALTRLGVAALRPRHATRAALVDPVSGDALDHGLVLWFPAPASFTGEEVAELHVHGGRAVVDSVLHALAGIAGLRPAEPGEFARRAFDHGKLDLTQAEALADLIDAETLGQQRQALRQFGGALKALYDEWRARLISSLAHLEAVIDFPDEDLPPDVAATVWRGVRDLRARIDAHLDDGRRGERVREGLSIVILGAPNAGKSSLLNWLARREAAIVAASPGTTRDVIEVHMDLGGFAVTIADTAGLREAADAIENEGVRRARGRAEIADIKLVLFDATRPRDAATEALIDSNSLVIMTKTDLKSGAEGVSVVTGAGMESFLTRLTGMVAARVGGGEAAPITRARHRAALTECRDALSRALDQPAVELAAEDLRLAARALGRITGRIDVEEMLDAVFRDFCIGK